MRRSSRSGWATELRIWSGAGAAEQRSSGAAPEQRIRMNTASSSSGCLSPSLLRSSVAFDQAETSRRRSRMPSPRPSRQEVQDAVAKAVELRH